MEMRIEKETNEDKREKKNIKEVFILTLPLKRNFTHTLDFQLP